MNDLLGYQYAILSTHGKYLHIHVTKNDDLQHVVNHVTHDSDLMKLSESYIKEGAIYLKGQKIISVKPFNLFDAYRYDGFATIEIDEYSFEKVTFDYVYKKVKVRKKWFSRKTICEFSIWHRFFHKNNINTKKHVVIGNCFQLEEF